MAGRKEARDRSMARRLRTVSTIIRAKGPLPTGPSAEMVARHGLDALDFAEPHRGLRKLSGPERDLFWRQYIARRPALDIRYGNTYSRWRPVAGTDLFLSLYITNRSVGLFVRGERGLSLTGALRKLEPYEKSLCNALGVSSVSEKCPYLSRLPLAASDPETWPQGHDWLLEREEFYHRTLARIVGGIEESG